LPPLVVEVAQVIGLIISNFPGAEYDPLHYWVFEHDKINALATNAGNFNTPMRLSAVPKGTTVVDCLHV